MLHSFLDKGDWFAPKAYGYGAGWPIAWQGWALLLAYIGVTAGIAWMVEWDRQIGLWTGMIVLLPATIALFVIVRRRTRGGWRWRWGEWD